MLRPAKSLRFRLAEDGRMFVSLSSSSGEFFLSPEILELLRVYAAEPSNVSTGAAKKVRRNLQATLDDVPGDKEIKDIIDELLDAGVLIDSAKSGGRALQRDGFGDPWVQWTMLADERRTRTYLEAVGAKVKPGHTVVDVGAGTGILTVAALEAGAKKVFAIEETDIAKMLRSNVTKLGYKTERLEIFNGNSADFERDEKIDVVVSELFGNDPFCEGVLHSLYELSTRLNGKPTYVPESVTCFVDVVDLLNAPMKLRLEALLKQSQIVASKQDDIYQKLLALNYAVCDFRDLSFPVPVREKDFTRASESVNVGSVPLSPPPAPDEVKFGGKFKTVVSKNVSVPIALLWFRAKIGAGKTLSNHPMENDFAEHWSPILIPLREALKKGDTLTIETKLGDNFDRTVVTIFKEKKEIGGRA